MRQCETAGGAREVRSRRSHGGARGDVARDVVRPGEDTLWQWQEAMLARAEFLEVEALLSDPQRVEITSVRRSCVDTREDARERPVEIEATCFDAASEVR